MNRRFKFNDFENIESVLGKLSQNLGFNRRIKESTIISMWTNVIGSKFENNSKILSVIKKNNYDVLLVSTSSSIVSQELYLYKRDILRKLSSIASSLGFNIRDIIFTNKYWRYEGNKNNLPVNETRVEFKREPTDSELNSIQVSEDIFNSIKSSIETQNFSSDELKNRMLYTILRDIKVKIWKKENGFPLCDDCGLPLNSYIEGEKNLCPSCKYNSEH